jgi:hypothetical protein
VGAIVLMTGRRSSERAGVRGPRSRVTDGDRVGHGFAFLA